MGKNKILCEIFSQMADALDFLGENPFKISAYRKASRVLEDYPTDIEEVYRGGGITALTSIPGIGAAMAKKIVEFLETGRMHKYEEVISQVPQDLLRLIDVQGIGPKTLKLAYDQLGVRSIQDFKRVLDDGSLAKLPGMGNKKVDNIKKGLELYEKMSERIPLGLAFPIVQETLRQMKQLSQVRSISACGSFRRMKETIGDVDILCTGDNGRKIIDHFVHLPGVTRILAAGDTKGSVIFNDRYQVDLRVVPVESYGAALQYFTGSKQHNIHLRTIAKALELKISEYGVFRGQQRVGGQDEKDIYGALGLQWIPPELREDLGEVEAAAADRLPQLIQYEDIKGDLHVHSKYSDGTGTLEELLAEAQRRGYQYIAVCDHSRSARYARGLEVEKLLEKVERIEKLNRDSSGARLLAGTEVDILPDGSLDYPDEVLKRLEFVVAAIHSWRKEEDVTGRILKAMENPYVHAIAHPTGRLISTREGYRVDVDRVIERAAQTGTALEINAYYDRLDLNDTYVRRAKELGVKVAIGTDAHNIGQLWMIVLGVGVARRGWCDPSDVLNAWDYEQIIEWTRQKGSG
ncbi:MAG: DNA polymerase/3'-5' exonuclease PolX [Deltaproteobacteria bacterium]|nr:MAG: DNA polymerase/3'-5' exonuclease PolX [Deltaproteobacteria bacterium]